MHCCEFCLTDHEVRPQVKNPRACQKPECQAKRQRLNEREWREQNPGLYDSKYHEAKRAGRIEQILSIAGIFQKCFQIGANLTGTEVSLSEFGEFFARFLLGLGVRQINKFWKAVKGSDSTGLEVAINQS